MNTVSVIIPACNVEDCLGKAVDSVLEQSLPVHEIIVVDDGSTDGTGRVAVKYGDRIIYAEQENLGQGAARNHGLKLATGDYIAFLDADDLWTPEFIKTSVEFLENHPDAIAVSCASVTRMADGSEIIAPNCVADKSFGAEPVVLDDFYRFWAEQDHVRTGTVLMRRSVIDQAGGQCANLRISQDLEYWGYLATFGKWGFIPEPLWVGNSRQVGRKSGWVKKYRKRRRLCPTVEAWHSRILPRLTESQMPYVEEVRGRVAAGYAHAKILGGDKSGALEIVRKYGDDMPQNRVTLLMDFGARGGVVGWWLVCAILVTREHLK